MLILAVLVESILALVACLLHGIVFVSKYYIAYSLSIYDRKKNVDIKFIGRDDFFGLFNWFKLMTIFKGGVDGFSYFSLISANVLFSYLDHPSL